MRSPCTFWPAPLSALSRPRCCRTTRTAMCRGSMTASDRAVRSRARLVSASLLVTALLVAAIGVPRPLSAHPLDALSVAEIGAAISVLRAAGHADAATRFPLITLAEPEKQAVLAGHPGQNFARKAFVVARQQRIVYEGVVDLAAGKLERWDAVPDVQPAISLDELTDAQKITIVDPQWRAAMQRRGYVSIDPAKLFCAPLPAGSGGDPSEQGRRLVRVTCFDATGSCCIAARSPSCSCPIWIRIRTGRSAPGSMSAKTISALWPRP